MCETEPYQKTAIGRNKYNILGLHISICLNPEMVFVVMKNVVRDGWNRIEKQSWINLSQMVDIGAFLLVIKSPLAIDSPIQGAGCTRLPKITLHTSEMSYILVNGRLMVMLERNPSGGYLTKGIDIVGVMVRSVPGGSASRPSFVIQSILFWRECGFEDDGADVGDGSCPPAESPAQPSTTPAQISSHLPIALQAERKVITHN